MFDNPILKMLMDRYGHIEDLDQLQDAMRSDGFGEFIDAMNDNPEIMDSVLEEHREEVEQSLRHYTGSGIMAAQEPVQGLPLGLNDAFKFNPGSCLAECDGKCCKDRNYLMISYPDIFKLLASPAARHLNIYSTCDLFDRKPQIIELFAAEEYDLFLPYLRFLPVGAEPDTRPEDAGSNICPFLYPIADVFAFHKLQLPENTNSNAMGCMLMGNKPMICHLSPVGQHRGMITGRLSYEYMEPTRNCPGCATDIEIPLASYIRGMVPSSEERERELFHEMVLAHHASCNQGQDQKQFNSVLREFYNIDHFLSLYGYTHMQRPGYTQLMEILIAAAEGNFALYDDFHQSLIHRTHGKIKANRFGRASEADAAMESDNDAVSVEYYEHKANADFSLKDQVARNTARYQELYNYNKIFSTVDSLLANVSIIDSSEVDQHQRLASTELEEDFMMILYYIELAITETYQEICDLTDRIVANVLNELISRKEDRIYRVDYLKANEERAHRKLMARMISFDLESKCPKRILINALKKVLGSVRGFIKQGAAIDAYLEFIVGYFKKM